MTDIDEIRKKHEERRKRVPNGFTLTESDVDALFAALDEVKLWIERIEILFDPITVKFQMVQELKQILKGGGE